LNSAHDRREAGLVALSVDIALVMLGGDVSGDREPRLALHDLGRLRGGGDAVPHLREDGGEKGVMRAVGPVIRAKAKAARSTRSRPAVKR
jgi:hypothetical protein